MRAIFLAWENCLKFSLGSERGNGLIGGALSSDEGSVDGTRLAGVGGGLTGEEDLGVDGLGESLAVSEGAELGVRVSSTDERLVSPAEDGGAEAVAGGGGEILVVSKHLVQLGLEQASDGLVVQRSHVLGSISNAESSDGPRGVGATVRSSIDPEFGDKGITANDELNILRPESLLELEDDLYNAIERASTGVVIPKMKRETSEKRKTRSKSIETRSEPSNGV